MSSDIKNIIFDVGDVLVGFYYRRYMKDLGFDEKAVDFLSENMVLTEVWHRLDLGIITQTDAVSIFTQDFPQYKNEINKFWNNIEGIVEEFNYSKDLLRAIKKRGYKVFLLSNYPVEAAQIHWPRFTFTSYVDGCIISGFEKITKPDSEIYRLFESRFGLNLSECLFIDDRQENVEGALAVGMKGLLFTGYSRLKEDLKKMDIL